LTASGRFIPEPAIDLLDRHAITDIHESPDSTLAADKKDPIAKTDPAEPTPPMESTEPIDPTDKTEFREPMDRNESRDQRDHREPLSGPLTESIFTSGIL
jgi:hypothetical protein